MKQLRLFLIIFFGVLLFAQYQNIDLEKYLPDINWRSWIPDNPFVSAKVERIMFVYEPGDISRMPKEQAEIINSVPLRALLKERNIPCLFADDDSKLDLMDKKWQEIRQSVGDKKGPVVVFSTSGGNKVVELPRNMDEFKKLLEGYL